MAEQGANTEQLDGGGVFQHVPACCTRKGFVGQEIPVSWHEIHRDALVAESSDCSRDLGIERGRQVIIAHPSFK